MSGKAEIALSKTHKRWLTAWAPALTAWSRFTRLSPPRFVFSTKEEKEENLTGSFAMIRLTDHAVVISLRQVEELKLEKFGKEILAHEIGHHVFAPGDLADNARLIANIRVGLASEEKHAPFIANIYTDLLINDRLQRFAEYDMAGVYKALKRDGGGALWTLYMRIYENLWSLPPKTLTDEKISEKINVDAQLGAKVIRVYAKDWLAGAGRFAVLCLPYLLKDKKEGATGDFSDILDTQKAGEGEEIPDGLASYGEGEEEGAIHPADDEEITGLGSAGSGEDDERGNEEPRKGDSAEEFGGRKNRYRSPSEYLEIMKSVGVKINENEMIVRYYRERARPYLIRFPVKESRRSSDPLPEGTEQWEAGEQVSDIDWMETVVKSPHVIPGVTTVKRIYGATDGFSPEKIPLDLYIGIDCSGSMRNPKHTLSYPVLAGTIIAMSALRTGARVMACLSGEPGKFTETDGFIKNETGILKLLTGYLGTGYAYGVLRLRDAILEGEPLKRPTHLLVVTDSDIFYMLSEVKGGWTIIEKAAEKAGGGATFLLNIPNPQGMKKEIEKLAQSGWRVHLVSTEEEMIAFARAFAKERYETVQ